MIKPTQNNCAAFTRPIVDNAVPPAAEIVILVFTVLI
jgi:hypothetical protein